MNIKSISLGLWVIGCAHTNLFGNEVPQRLHQRISNNNTFQLSGNVHPALTKSQDEGEVSSTFTLPHIALYFRKTVQQQEDLDELIRKQQTRGSNEFHKFLTPEEFGARFGLALDDLSKVTEWLESQGFSDIQTARSRTFISFAGTAAHVQIAFNTSIHRYVEGGETHYANVSDPFLPKDLEGVVESIHDLDDFRLKPRGIRQQPRFNFGVNGKFLVPDDFETIYNVQPLYQLGLDGTGVKIAVAGQSNIRLGDIRAFRSASGLPPNDPVVVLAGNDPGLKTSSGDELESDLDVEWAGAIAKNATVVFVTSPNIRTSISYAIDNNIAPILSLSYGSCESGVSSTERSTESSLYQQANVEGMTVIAAVGDSGAADCDMSAPAQRGLSVDLPAGFPYVTGIGGTTLRPNDCYSTCWVVDNNRYGGSAVSYIPETAWNDSGTTGRLSATGGGASRYNPKPAWQAGVGLPVDGARDVPDLAFAASPSQLGYLICSAGNCVNGFQNTDLSISVVGGTSVGSPSFAGIMALLIQALGLQGNINPNLYALASRSTKVFHDITTGSNVVACTAGTPNCPTGTMGYSTGIGYDQVTGLGSVDAYELFRNWTNDIPSPLGAIGEPLRFIPITPCRVADTRNPTGAYGGPALYGLASRDFNISGSACNIPSTAAAYALNLTVAPNGPLSFLSIWPSGHARPLVSTLNSDGRIKANAAIVPAGANGNVSVFATNSTHLIIDISGYFVPSSGSSGLQFFPLRPCRVADTRTSFGSLGGPFLSAGQSRDFPVLSSPCNVPGNAQAYSLNLTAVPREPLYFVSAWPSGQEQPFTSVLNAPNGNVTANAAIIPAGSNGSISAFASNNTDLVIDINGYFAPPTTGGLNFYTLTPCRVIDTRNPDGSLPFSGFKLVDITMGCEGFARAEAYVLNATVVPSGPLWYLTLSPIGQDLPFVSTLNADPNTVTSNMAIVPTSNSALDSVGVYAAGSTHLILDISGFFGPF